MTEEFTRLLEGREQEEQRLNREAARLDDERLKLPQAHYASAIPLDLMKREQERIGGRIEAVRRKLARMSTQVADLAATLKRTLAYLSALATAYAESGANARRRMNQALYERIEVGDDDTFAPSCDSRTQRSSMTDSRWRTGLRQAAGRAEGPGGNRNAPSLRPSHGA